MEGSVSSSSHPKSAVRQDSHRSSANPETSRFSARRPSSRAQVPTSTSPEVISSLISSLSAISAPAEDFYDSLIPDGAVSKSAPPPIPRSHLSHNVRDDTIQEHPRPGVFLHPDEAAIPPIVRTSKPPSGFSPVTAPKKNKAPPVLFTTSSIHDLRRSRSSIGSVSIGPRHKPSSTSLQTFSTSNSWSSKSLRLIASKEKLREFDKERKRGAYNLSPATSNGEWPPGSYTDLSSLANRISPDVVGGSTGPEIPARIAVWHVPAPREPITASSFVPSSPGSPSKIPVPDRRSSLRHSFGPTEKRKHKTSPHKGKRKDTRSDPSTGSEEGQESPMKMKGKEKATSDAEEGVARRIQELKMQKELRRISQQTIADRERSEEAERIEKSLRVADSNLGNKMDVRSASALTAPGKENSNPAGDADTTKPWRDPLTRSATEPIPLDHTKTFDHIALPRVSSSMGRPLPSLADSIDEAIDEYLASPRLSQKVKDPCTGRVIAFSEVGDPTGSIVFCCVGMGTTRYLMAFYDELATTFKLRIITPDRPGIGESQPHADGTDTPLGWPDDIRTICANLGISRFSILAHSAGAVYALATALRMPEHIRGRVHLMAPWIPPSQMTAVGIQKDQVPNTSLPYGQRLLRSLPTPFLKVANSGFFAMTSNSLASAMPKNSPRRKNRRSLNDLDHATIQAKARERRSKRSSMPVDRPAESPSTPNGLRPNADTESIISSSLSALPGRDKEPEYQFRLTHAIWEAATTNANPAVDLLVCLERRQDIGFRYADVSREVVIHHGAKDTRVPVENVEWLANRMRRCELRLLEDEGHGLMASATVMSNVLSEMAQEWDDWNVLTKMSSQNALEKGERINWPLR